jgi:hypothetical protein
VLPVLIAAVLACGPGGAVGPTLAPPDSPTPAPTLPAATEAPAADPIVVTHQGSAFHLYALDGTLLETRPADGLDWARPNTAQVVGDDIFYVATRAPGPGAVVRRVTPTGAEDLAFTAIDDIGALAFSVSGDGSRIAWSLTTWGGPPDSRLWIANLDGSAMTLVVESDPGDAIAEYFVLEPVDWLPNGDLIYAWQISGIGGYILFFGWSSLYQFDPETAALTSLAPLLSDSQGPCWSDVTDDGSLAVGACGPFPQMVERDTATGVETHFPVLPDQGQAGAGAYSPTGNRLAYAIARSDMENEAGQIVVVPSRGAAPSPLASQAPGYFDRIEWIDEDRVAVGTWVGDAGFVELLRIDGARSPLGSGRLIGLMRPDGG